MTLIQYLPYFWYRIYRELQNILLQTNNQDFDDTNLRIILIISEIKKKFAEALRYAPKR